VSPTRFMVLTGLISTSLLLNRRAAAMNKKKSYLPPHLVEYPPGHVSEDAWLFQANLTTLPPAERNAARILDPSVVDGDSEDARVFNSFCELLGYKRFRNRWSVAARN
jgi:hypothetical protein